MKTLFLFFFPLFLFANTIILDYGKGEKDKNFYNIELSFNTPIKNLPTYTSLGIGGWDKEESSFFGSINEGIKYGKKYFTYAQVGVAALANTTKNLSTSLEFTEKIGIGLNLENFDISLFYRHISNGGIKKPNRGENFTGITLYFNF